MSHRLVREKLIVALLALIISAGFVYGAGRQSDSEGARSLVIFGPRPDYPYEARRARMVGRGLSVLEVDTSTGRVTHAYMAQSTGYWLLDDATLKTFRHWTFRPGTISKVCIPIAYTMQGEVITTVHVEAKPMDTVLSRFLGKGTVINGPMPQYPRSVPWREKSGQGLYELRIGPKGDALSAKILKSSGDSTFDETTVAALQNWRLRRGPMVIELPLSFHLTGSKYSVSIPRHP